MFGELEWRHLADFRRSGTVEALSGNASAETVSAKMANSLAQSNFLHQTYAPAQLATVRDADAARRRGRAKLRVQGTPGEQTGTKIPTAHAEDSNNSVQQSAKALK